MLVTDIFTWWYSAGFGALFSYIKNGYGAISTMFSFEILVRTWFAPWRRIISYPGASFDDKMRAIADNAFSRVIGFTIRTMVMLAGVVCYAIWTLKSGLLIIGWPLVLPAIPLCLVVGVLTI